MGLGKQSKQCGNGFGPERVSGRASGPTRGQGLLELVRLVGVGDAQGVQVLAAPHLELGHVARLLDLHGCDRMEAGYWGCVSQGCINGNGERIRGVSGI